MKKHSITLACICIIVMVFSSCVGSGLISTEQSHFPEESGQDTGKGSSTKEEPAADLFFTGGWFTYPSAISASIPALSAGRTVFPDTLCSFEGKEDVRTEHGIHVGALNLDFEIPEGFYAYAVPGQYWDYTENKAVTLDFVREYVFTVKNVTEEQLLSDMEVFFEHDAKLEGVNPFPYYRGPGYVVYSFRVFQKDYLPIESLFTSLLANSGEYLVGGAYCVSLGKSDVWEKYGKATEEWYSAGILTDKDALYTNGWNPEKENVSLADRIAAGVAFPVEGFPLWNWIRTLTDHLDWRMEGGESVNEFPVDGFTYQNGSHHPPMFRGGTASRFMQYGQNDRLQCSNVVCSVLSDEWWKWYQYARTELKDHADRYLHSGMKTDWGAYYNSGYWSLDEEHSIEIRAYIYANLRMHQGTDLPLEDLVVFLHESEKGYQQYFASVKSGEELMEIEEGWNALPELDLEFAREYAGNYMSAT